MDRLSRLRELVQSGGLSRVPAVPPRVPNLAPGPLDAPPRRELTYEPLGADGLPVEARAELPSLDGAAWLETPYGRVVVIDAEFPPEFRHGRVAVQDLGQWDTETLALVQGRPLGSIESRPAALPLLFLDLETTGLSGGAGTVPFLVGCGFVQDGRFRTRQFFLQGFSAERALLHAVTGTLAEAGLLVTYNGRTFDMPIMETRWLFHRMPVAHDGLPHLDMLPPSRRLWREAADAVEQSCRLVSLEHLLCGVTRVGDVPGFEIPQRYFEYVRRGDARLLEPVLYHNRMDLLSLAALTARAQRLVRDGADAAADAVECLALGRLLERRGRPAEAERCYRRVTSAPDATGGLREQALHALARSLRRQRRFREAAQVWRELVAGGVGRTPALREAVEALAIHHEHRDKDLLEAHALARRALQTERDPRQRAAVAHRLARLERKLSRASGDVQPALISQEPIEPDAQA